MSSELENGLQEQPTTEENGELFDVADVKAACDLEKVTKETRARCGKSDAWS